MKILKQVSKLSILCSLPIFIVQNNVYSKSRVLQNKLNSVKPALSIYDQLGKLNETNLQLSLNAINDIVKNKITKYTTYKQYYPVKNSILKDFDGNVFVLVEFYPTGYGIYNVSNGDIVELSSSANSPYYSLNNHNNLYYVPMAGYYKKVNNSYVDILTNQSISSLFVDELKSLSNNLQMNAIKYINSSNVKMVLEGLSTNSINTYVTNSANLDVDINDLYQSADVEVPYSWYFKLNHSSYPENITGTCGYTALSLILGYTEIFLSKGYFSTEEVSNYIIPYEGNYATGVPTITDGLLNEFDENLEGSVPSDLTAATNLFMQGKNKEYEIYEHVWRFSNITDPIKDGVPTAYFGNYSDTILETNDHVTVVYGYDNDGMLLLHTGWYVEEGDILNNTNIKISRLGFFKEGGVFALYNKSAHQHNNYFHIGPIMKMCGCGVLVEC